MSKKRDETVAASGFIRVTKAYDHKPVFLNISLIESVSTRFNADQKGKSVISMVSDGDSIGLCVLESAQEVLKKIGVLKNQEVHES